MDNKIIKPEIIVQNWIKIQISKPIQKVDVINKLSISSIKQIIKKV